MKTKRNKRVESKRLTTHVTKHASKSQPFTAHLLELRRRVFLSIASIALWATAAYFAQQQIVAVLLKPAGNQQFIYTSPGGGLNFLIQLCVYAGVLLSVPVIVYNVLKFVEPVMSEASSKFILRGSMAAGLLALSGVVFTYYFGLPSALKFLSHQFVTDQVQALIAVQSYMGFVVKFLFAGALMFQAPLIMLFINRIKPLKPSKLIRGERWAILASLILGAVISPTPDIRSMLLLSIPMILTYQVGIALIWHVNQSGRKSKSVLALIEKDAAIQAERFQRLSEAFVVRFEPLELQPVLIPIDSTPETGLPQTNESQPEPELQQTTTGLSGGRTSYQYAMPSQRVRRRIML